MKNGKIRNMQVEFLSSKGSDSYVLGRITAVVDINLNGGERTLIIGSTMRPDIYRLRFWATDKQYERIRNGIEKLIPMKMVYVKCYDVIGTTTKEF